MQGGDSDDDAESVGSGFTSIAFEKAETSMLPPTSKPAPRERFGYWKDQVVSPSSKSVPVEGQDKVEQAKTVSITSSTPTFYVPRE